MMDWWSEALEIAAAETAGGGVISRVRIEFGYKVFVAGAPQAETFFPAPAGKSEANTRARAEALARAKEYARSTGQRPQWALQIRAFRNTAVVRGEPATWTDDRFFVVSAFAEAFKVVAESLQNAGIPSLPWEGWVRIGFINDPYHERQGEQGMTDRDADGNPRFPQVAVIREVFSSEDAARAAALGEASGSPEPAPNIPPGYVPATWGLVSAEIRKGAAAGKSVQQLAAEYGVGESWVEQAIAGKA